MSGITGNRLITEGLIFYLSSRQPRSYPSQGEHIYDIVNNFDGSLYNNVGFDGNYLTFDGIDQYIQIQDFGNIKNHTSSIWFYTTSLTSVKNIFDFNTNETGGNAGIRIEQFTPPGFFYNYGNGTGSALFAVSMNTTDNCGVGGDFPGVVEENRWSNLVISYEEISEIGFFTVYFNGVQVTDNQTMSSPFVGHINDFVIGSGYNNSRFFQGKISSFAIWNKKLSNTEILENFAFERKKYSI